jgi:hypothetical protein
MERLGFCFGHEGRRAFRRVPHMGKPENEKNQNFDEPTNENENFLAESGNWVASLER